MTTHTIQLAAICAAASFLASTPIYAGDDKMIIPPAGTAPAADGGWEFTLSPYAWAAGLDGSVGIGNVVAEVDQSFSDIVDKLDVAAMLHFEARKGPWAFMLDGFWLRLEAGADTPGPLYGGAEVEVEELRLSGLIAYRAIEGPTKLDLLTGISYFSVDTDFRLTPGLLAGREISFSEDWVDPVVGFHLRHELCERWFAMLRGEIGGFDAGSEFTWQAMTGVGYRAGDSSEVFLGYRHLDIDYSDNDFTYDTSTSGIILGVNFSF